MQKNGIYKDLYRQGLIEMRTNIDKDKCKQDLVYMQGLFILE